MKHRWWVIGTAAVLTGSLVFLVRWIKKKNGLLHFIDEEDNDKNFGVFPPEIPYSEFEGVDFLS